jgi:hypothetical protein
MRLSMGLGIIFCLTEIQLLQDTKAQIVDGKPADKSLAYIQSFFQSYCTFEIIFLFRITFFLCFNLLNTYSLCFVVDDQKDKIAKSATTYTRQLAIIGVLEELFNMQSANSEISNKMHLDSEMSKIEY